MTHVCQLKQYMVRISLGVSLKLSIYYEISIHGEIIRKLVCRRRVVSRDTRNN